LTKGSELQSEGEWQIVFYIAAGIYLFGCIVYWIWCQASVQPWAVQSEINSETEKY
jgi:MFS transporter, ACS family, solute carrier family 17 (sodium-dependent inorganic phosphate cotransporter), other